VRQECDGADNLGGKVEEEERVTVVPGGGSRGVEEEEMSLFRIKLSHHLSRLTQREQEELPERNT
jgi:hypothetical protein